MFDRVLNAFLSLMQNHLIVGSPTKKRMGVQGFNLEREGLIK